MKKTTKAILKTAKILAVEKRGSYPRQAIADEVREARKHGLRHVKTGALIERAGTRKAARGAQVRGLRRLQLGFYDRLWM